MSRPLVAVEVYIEDDHAHIIDHRGHGEIPVRHLHLTANYANRSDHSRALYFGRWFDRDALNSAVSLLDAMTRCHFADQHTACDERAGTDADGNTLTNLSGQPVCELHAPDDDSGATE